MTKCPTILEHHWCTGQVQEKRLAPYQSGTDEVSSQTCPACWSEAGDMGIVTAYRWRHAHQAGAAGWEVTGFCQTCGAPIEPQFIRSPLQVEITLEGEGNPIPGSPAGTREFWPQDETGAWDGPTEYSVGKAERAAFGAWILAAYRAGYRIVATVLPDTGAR